VAEALKGPRAIVGIRRRLLDTTVPKWEKEYRAYFRGFSGRFLKWARSHMKDAGSFHVKQSGDDVADLDVEDFDWDGEQATLKQLLNQQYASMTEVVWSEVAGQQVGQQLAFDLNARNVRAVLAKVGKRITQINDASQRAIAELVAREIEKSSNADLLEKAIGALLRSWGEDGGRAHIIALTESANAYNQSAVAAYREANVEMVEVYDGPDCGWTEHDDPDLADGSTRTLDEAEEYPEAHPHCQRAFGPVVKT